jgi:hypothetical protein
MSSPIIRYSDISNAPIAVGDFIQINDKESQSKYTFEVLAINPEKNDVRSFKLRVIESTNEKVPTGSDIPDFPIDRTKVKYGAIIRHEDIDKRLTDVQRDHVAVVELRNFLDSKPTKAITFKSAIAYLSENNIFTRDLTFKQMESKLRALTRKHKDLLWSRGGYVGSTGASMKVEGPSTLDVTTNASETGRRYITIDWKMLTAGLMMVLDSIDTIRIVNND